MVVDHHSGELLTRCVASLQAEGFHPVVVVDNADPPAPGRPRLRPSLASAPPRPERRLPDVVWIDPARNLGYGAGANRGVAAVTGTGPVLVANPDVALHSGAAAALAAALDADPSAAVVGPRIVQADGTRYPSARRFPSLVDAAGHALLSSWWPDNRFSRRYRMDDLSVDQSTPVDWVSGACMLVRRSAWEELGGFDESYFMYAEDMDLCWRARQAGWQVLYVPQAVVTHLQGRSTRRRPYRMLLAHHRSALRFAVRTERGWRRPLLPVVAAALALRLLVECLRLAAEAGGPARSDADPAGG